jgi:hypothetical protein
MMQHPSFNLDVAKRKREHNRVEMLELQKKIKAQEAKTNLKKGKIGGLPSKETKPSSPKKRKDKAMSQDTESLKGDAAS